MMLYRIGGGGEQPPPKKNDGGKYGSRRFPKDKFYFSLFFGDLKLHRIAGKIMWSESAWHVRRVSWCDSHKNVHRGR